MTSFNGTNITYDGIGNPLSYYNGTAYTFTWEGRRLLSAVTGGKTYTFTYNSEGIRTSKTVNGVTTNYYLNGSQIVAEETNGNITVYIYDASGAPIGFHYHAATYANDLWDAYWYEKNLHGDIVAVYNAAGTKLASYIYNAWGSSLTTYYNGGASTQVAKNPFTYRGYYFDYDLVLYYLNSRYYDPVTSRFISADDASYLGLDGSILSYNLFAYCMNDPVNRFDEYGNWSLPNWAKVAIGAAATVAAVVVTVATGGAAAPVLIGVGVSITSSALIGGVISVKNEEDFWSGFADGAADGAMWGGAFALAGATIGAIRYGLSAKGAVKGTQHLTTIAKGQQFDRFGRLTGKYITDIGTPASKLALPSANTGVKTSLQATRNFRVITGIIADGFGGTGGGTQYVMRYSIEKLIEMGWLIII